MRNALVFEELLRLVFQTQPRSGPKSELLGRDDSLPRRLQTLKTEHHPKGQALWSGNTKLGNDSTTVRRLGRKGP
jgi:hypothetical protein